MITADFVKLAELILSLRNGLKTFLTTLHEESQATINKVDMFIAMDALLSKYLATEEVEGYREHVQQRLAFDATEGELETWIDYRKLVSSFKLEFIGWQQ